MRITKENYEVFVLDYLEDKLDADMKKRFLLFLEANPGIREEVGSFELIELSPDGPEYSGKDLLKKKELDLLDAIPAFEKSCIAAIEHDLDETASEIFHHELMQHPAKGIIFQDFIKTILKPESVSFDSKNTLKKPVFIGRRNRPLVWYAVASVILFFLLIRPFTNQDQQDGNFASTEQKNGIVRMEEDKNPGNESTDHSEIIPEIVSTDVHIKPVRQIEKNKTLLTSSGSGELSFLMEKENIKIHPLSGKSEILPQAKINSLALHAPVIYIPVYLDTKDLKALENITLDDFKVKIIQEPVEHKRTPVLFAILRSGIKKLNKETGPGADPGIKVKEKGKLTAFAFSSPNIVFRTKGRNKTPKITNHP